MKALYAEFTVAPGCEAQAAGLMAEFSARVRREPGNVSFEPFTRTDRPRDYFVFEIYRDDAAFEDHLASEHNRLFNARLSGLIEGEGSALTWLTPLSVPPAVRDPGRPVASGPDRSG